MYDLRELGTTSTRWACVGNTVGNVGVIDVSPLLTETPVNLSVQLGALKYWIGSVMRPGVQLILGNLKDEKDVDYRNGWAFWAPVVVDGQIHDTLFTARDQNNSWRFGLFVYGGTSELHDVLNTWVLIATPEELHGGSVTAYPESTKEKGMLVTSFEVISPGGIQGHQMIGLNSRPTTY